MRELVEDEEAELERIAAGRVHDIVRRIVQRPALHEILQHGG